MSENLEILTNQKIISILTGDTEFGKFTSAYTGPQIRFSMPYLDETTIRDIANSLGLPIESEDYYGTQMCFRILLELFIKNKKIPQLLSYLFAKHQFESSFRDLQPADLDIAYKEITKCARKKINEILNVENYKLTFKNNKYSIEKKNISLSVYTPSIEHNANEYIRTITKRALEDITKGSFDSALTKSRTLLEEVFCYVIEQKGEVPSKKGEIKKLYGQVKDLYRMHTNKDIDTRINSLLSGLETILIAITEMRNSNGDAHGVGNQRFKIKKHHAILFMNAAMVMAEFILNVKENKIKK